MPASGVADRKAVVTGEKARLPFSMKMFGCAVLFSVPIILGGCSESPKPQPKQEISRMFEQGESVPLAGPLNIELYGYGYGGPYSPDIGVLRVTGQYGCSMITVEQNGSVIKTIGGDAIGGDGKRTGMSINEVMVLEGETVRISARTETGLVSYTVSCDSMGAGGCAKLTVTQTRQGGVP